MKHRHQCGDVGVVWYLFDPKKGCGHLWTHELRVKVGTVRYEKAHMCPKCGRGPWKYILLGELPS